MKLFFKPTELVGDRGYKNGNPNDSREANFTIKYIKAATTPNIPKKLAPNINNNLYHQTIQMFEYI